MAGKRGRIVRTADEFIFNGLTEIRGKPSNFYSRHCLPAGRSFAGASLRAAAVCVRLPPCLPRLRQRRARPPRLTCKTTSYWGRAHPATRPAAEGATMEEEDR